MLPLPAGLSRQFQAVLDRKGVTREKRFHYLKWLRYDPDFCVKYGFDRLHPESFPHFLDKLRQKKQTEAQQKQAAETISWFYELMSATGRIATGSLPGPQQVPAEMKLQKKTYQAGAAPRKSSSTPAGGAALSATENAKSAAARWAAALERLSDEIKLRHYSPKTFKAYSIWIFKLRHFTRQKDPQTVTPEDVKAFLTFLAVKQKVSASSQNQAFNALLFFFRHVLKKEFGQLDGVVRAKRKPYIPVVLSREEIDTIFQNLKYPYDLVCKLLYGCGLRISECLELRVQCFNFDAGVVTVHDGKGQKDRTVPLPQSLLPELKAHLQRVRNLHRLDLAGDCAGAFMPGSLERKYRNAGKELIWQWFFPAKALTYVPDTKEFRRYHLHRTHVQKAIRRAVRKAQIAKRASAHTFRHYAESLTMPSDRSLPTSIYDSAVTNSA